MVSWNRCWALACIFWLTSCGTTAPVAGTGITEKDLSSAIGQLSFEREIAEIYVISALARAGADGSWRKDIEEKYGRAAALGNSLIDKLQLSLTLRKVDAEGLTNDVRQVADAVNELHKVVKPSPSLPSGKPTASALLDLITPAYVDVITKSALTLVKAAQEREDKLIEDIKGELNKQRWKRIRDLPVLS